MHVKDILNLKGHVRLFQLTDFGKVLLVDKNNLIVYSGREWVLSRLVGVDNSNISAKSSDTISWLSFGTGGAPAGDPENPTPPSSNDNSIQEITIDSNDPNLYDGKKIPLKMAEYSSEIQFIQDNALDNRYLMVRCATVLNEDQANDQEINEAALWISDSNIATEATRFSLFAHVTFPTFTKQANFKYLFEWIIHS